jgi:L-lactate dehydrogenase complex protein LldG
MAHPPEWSGPMSTDRDRMLATIKAGVARSPTKDVAKPAHLIPQRGQRTGRALVDLFRQQAEAASASFVEVASSKDVPAAVTDYLKGRNLPAQVKLASDPRVAGLDWKSQPLLETTSGASDGFDLAAVTPVLSGVAETGTLFVHSGEPTPNTLHFLPETHIAIVYRDELVGTYEEAWAALRKKFGSDLSNGAMPRTVSMVTGPSRSADIGKILLMGAHGPKRLHIILVDEPRDSSRQN